MVIGGGIFLVPNLVAQELKSATASLAVWVLAGVISFFGALACAELGTALPSTGGQYVFLREAYGPLVGFLCGWSMFLVARTAQVAWLAVTMALYVSYFVPLSAPVSKLLGICAIALFTGINYRGVKAGAIVQKTFTLAKVAGLLIIIGSALLWGSKAASPPEAVAGGFSVSSFGVALIASLLAYDGWVQLTFVAGEIRNGRMRCHLLTGECGLSTRSPDRRNRCERSRRRHRGQARARLRRRQPSFADYSRVDHRDPEWMLSYQSADLFCPSARWPLLSEVCRGASAVSNAWVFDPGSRHLGDRARCKRLL
jgi:hypothetical protein